ncbi:MAG: TolC family protein [Planctomycetota bacterium]
MQNNIKNDCCRCERSEAISVMLGIYGDSSLPLRNDRGDFRVLKLVLLFFWMISCSDQTLREELEHHQRGESFLGNSKPILSNSEKAQVTSKSSESKEKVDSTLMREYYSKPAHSQNYFSPESGSLTLYEKEIESSLDLEKLLILVRYLNREIKSMEQSYHAVQERYPQALDLMNVLNQYESFTTEIGVSTSINESYPFPGTLHFKGQIIHIEAEIAFLEWQQMIRDTIYHTKEIYAKLYYLQSAIEITQKSIDLLRVLENTIREKYRTGETAQVVLLKIQLELLELQNEQITFQQEQKTQHVILNAHMDFPLNKPLGPISSLEIPTLIKEAPQMIELSLKYQQELLLMRREKEKMETMIQMVERETFPVVTSEESKVMTRMSRNDSKREEKPDLSFGASNSFIREMKIGVQALEKKIQEYENHARIAIQEGWFELDTQQRSERLYREELIPQATQSLLITQTSYFNNKSDFLDVIEALRLLLKFQLKAVEAKSEMYKALSTLEKTMGILWSDSLALSK